MFELSDEEDPTFWETLPFERLDTDNGMESPLSLREKENAQNRMHVIGRQQQKAPCIKEPAKRKAAKRKFPGPAGNLHLNISKETSSPECIRASPSTGPQLKSDDKKVEDPAASQARLVEEAFSSKQWKRLLSDLGPDASIVLTKFSIESMLVKARQKKLPRGKIPLILGYIERVDFQGSDGTIVLRDPSGKMNGSIHPELIKDPSTALQVGWVIVLRQVSVISPFRSHYLNITSDNIVAIYHLNREGEVTVTSMPCHDHQSPPSQGDLQTNHSHSLSWDKLIQESERELIAASAQTTPVVSRIPGSVSASNHERLSDAESVRKPGSGLSGRTHSNSPLFSTPTTSLHRARGPPTHVGHFEGNNINNADSAFQGVTSDGFDDDFPDDDDNDILSLCETGALDARCSSFKPDFCDSMPSIEGSSHFSTSIRTPCIQPPHKSLSVSHSSPILSKTALPSTRMNSSPNSETTKKTQFSFKLTRGISSPDSQPHTHAETWGSSSFHVKNQTSSAVIERCPDVRSNIGRDLKVQLGNNVAHSKENQTQMKDIFGQWNDDLSDELLSQLSEEF